MKLPPPKLMLVWFNLPLILQLEDHCTRCQRYCNESLAFMPHSGFALICIDCSYLTDCV